MVTTLSTSTLHKSDVARSHALLPTYIEHYTYTIFSFPRAYIFGTLCILQDAWKKFHKPRLDTDNR